MRKQVIFLVVVDFFGFFSFLFFSLVLIDRSKHLTPTDIIIFGQMTCLLWDLMASYLNHSEEARISQSSTASGSKAHISSYQLILIKMNQVTKATDSFWKGRFHWTFQKYLINWLYIIYIDIYIYQSKTHFLFYLSLSLCLFFFKHAHTQTQDASIVRWGRFQLKRQESKSKRTISKNIT